jgi:hypothetical protein
MAALCHDLARGVEHDDLDVGRADVEDRDAAVHALSPQETPQQARSPDRA